MSAAGIDRSVSPHSSVSQQTVEEVVTEASVYRELGKLVVAVGRLGLEPQQAFELLSQMAGARVAAGGGVGSHAGASVATDPSTGPVGSVRSRGSRRRKRGCRGARSAAGSSGAGGSPQTPRAFERDESVVASEADGGGKVSDLAGRCYYALLSLDSKIGGLGAYPTFRTMLESPVSMWNLASFGTLRVRRPSRDEPDIYHVASHGVLARAAFASVASGGDWPDGSLGEVLSREVVRCDLDGIIKPTSRLGGDPGVEQVVECASGRPGAASTPLDQDMTRADEVVLAKSRAVSREGLGWTTRQVKSFRAYCSGSLAPPGAFVEAFVPGFVLRGPAAATVDPRVFAVAAQRQGHVLPELGEAAAQRWFAPAGCQFVCEEEGLVFPDVGHDGGGRPVSFAWAGLKRVVVLFPESMWGTRVALRRLTGPAVCAMSSASQAHFCTVHASLVVPALQPEGSWIDADVAPAALPGWLSRDSGERIQSALTTLRVDAVVPATAGLHAYRIAHGKLADSRVWLLHAVEGPAVHVGGSSACGAVMVSSREYSGIISRSSRARALAVARPFGYTEFVVSVRGEAGRERALTFHLSAVKDEELYDGGGPDAGHDWDYVAWGPNGWDMPLTAG